MDLFVVNRHREEAENEENVKLQEQQKLAQLLKKIERNKRIRARQRERKKAKIQEKQAAEIKGKKRQKNQTIETTWNETRELQDDRENNDDINMQDLPQKVNTDRHVNKKTKLNINDITDIEGFTILGNNEFQTKAKVKRVLPKWLANPTIISTDLQRLQLKISSMKQLHKSLRKKLKSNNIEYFFPVQTVVIPWLLDEIRNSTVMFPRDVCVSAPTGSGKTLAFVLPIVHSLMSHAIKKIRALVILPTQDLAMQVFRTFKTYTEGTNIDACLITGRNLFVTEQKQLVDKNEAFGYLSKVDILVCTAGRLVDHLKDTEGFDLCDLEFLVIDEADRVLDNLQNDWLYHLEKCIQSEDTVYQTTKVLNLLSLHQRRPPQKLLFSATLSQDPEKLQKLSLFQPKLFTSVIEKEESSSKREDVATFSFVGKYTTPKELTEKYIVCSIDLKPLVLYEFIKTENLTKTLVFTNSTDSAHRLAILLSYMFKEKKSVKEMPSYVEINKRNELIRSFDNNQIDILVCTDRLARGIDLAGVQCVISYGAPKYLKTYIHRAGRTARAGQPGLAVTLLHQNQLSRFQASLQQADKTDLAEITVDEDKLEPLAGQYKGALKELKDAVQKEEERDLKKIKSQKRQRKKWEKVA